MKWKSFVILLFLVTLIRTEDATEDDVIEDKKPVPIDEPIVIMPRPRPPWPTPDPQPIPEEIFTVTSSSVIRPGQPLTVVGTRFYDYDKISRDITVQIIGTTEKGEKFQTVEKSFCLNEKEFDLVFFDTSDIPPGDYSLSVHTSDGFSELKPLTYSRKSETLIIQLNKGIFKPEDTVQFRVYCFDSETRARNPSKKVLVAIYDPNGNLIKEFNDVWFEVGIYGSEMILGSKAPLGMWSLKVTMGDEFYEKQFEVAEYTLSLFSVELSVQPVIPLSFSKVPVTIIAKYSFNEAVNGKATIRVSKYNGDVYKKDVTLNSVETIVDLDMNDLQAIFDEYTTSLYYQIFVTVEDELTQTKSSNEGYFIILKNNNEIIVNVDPYLVPDSPLNYDVVLRKYDGSPGASGTEITVEFTPIGVSQFLVTDENGRASSSIIIPSPETYVNIRARAKDANDGYGYAGIPWSGSDASLRLDVMTKEPCINDRIRVKVTSSVEFDFITLLITSKGVVLEHHVIDITDDLEGGANPLSITFEFFATFEYAPTTFIVAYMIRKGSLIAASTSIELDQKLPNSVMFLFTKREVKPACELSFDVVSDPNSTVCLLAVDQRVLFLSPLDDHKLEAMDGLRAYNNFGWNWDFRKPFDYAFSSSGVAMVNNLPYPIYRDEPQFLPEANEKAADSVEGSSSRSVEARKDFRETFLWQCQTVDSITGSASINTTVPESITTYIIVGTAMNENTGFGVSEPNAEVLVFLPFFISVEFPFSVKRNEILIQDILIFNYLGEKQDVRVTVNRVDGIEAPGCEEFGWEVTKSAFIANIPQLEGSAKLQLPIQPLKIGLINIQISAESAQARDAIEKPLRVISEGVPRTITKSLLIVFDEPSNFKGSLSFELPDGVISDTVEVSLLVAGNILGKTLNNLDSLITMPGGCGEQTLILLVPNIVIWEYLLATGLLKPETEAKLNQYALAGYQNQLTYQRTDGSFSAFGNNDPSGSTWLSAYTVKAFYMASKFITIDTNVMARALDFVVNNQNEDGSFNEPGRVIHVDMQGAAGSGIALTAYISAVLSEVSDIFSYTSNRDRANDFLVSSDLSDVYILGLSAYALSLADHPQASTVFDQFFALRTETDTEMFWQKSSEPPPESWYPPSSLDIELSAYGLLTTLLRNDLASAIKIVKYLTNNSNKLGGYSSSQDTVMAILALSKFAQAFSSTGIVELKVTPIPVGDEIYATVDPENSLLVQEFVLDPSVRQTDIEAWTETLGVAQVSLVASFYQDTSKSKPSFTIDYEFAIACNYRIAFVVCVAYIPEGNSNMAIIKVTMPSGFYYAEFWGPIQFEAISKVEVSNQGSTVVYYVNSIGQDAVCVSVNAYRAKFVRELKGGTIEVNDYYDTYKDAKATYEVPDLSGSCW